MAQKFFMSYFKILNFKVKTKNKKKITCSYTSRQGGETYNTWYCSFKEAKTEHYHIYSFILLMYILRFIITQHSLILADQIQSCIFNKAIMIKIILNSFYLVEIECLGMHPLVRITLYYSIKGKNKSKNSFNFDTNDI